MMTLKPAAFATPRFGALIEPEALMRATSNPHDMALILEAADRRDDEFTVFHRSSYPMIVGGVTPEDQQHRIWATAYNSLKHVLSNARKLADKREFAAQVSKSLPEDLAPLALECVEDQDKLIPLGTKLWQRMGTQSLNSFMPNELFSKLSWVVSAKP